MSGPDVFLVTSRGWDERRDRVVFALDEHDARRAHELHYPYETVVKVVAHA